jgi:hypothetical protein
VVGKEFISGDNKMQKNTIEYRYNRREGFEGSKAHVEDSNERKEDFVIRKYHKRGRLGSNQD